MPTQTTPIPQNGVGYPGTNPPQEERPPTGTAIPPPPPQVRNMANQFGEITRFKEKETLTFEPWPSVKNLTAWKASFRREVTNGSGRPEEALAVSYTHLTLPTICSV